MAKLTERYVQNIALDYLKSYYQSQYPGKQMFADVELRTKYKRKRGRADGLLAFRNDSGYIYTVSMEAKSHKTFSSLRDIPHNSLLRFMLIISFIFVASVFWFVFSTMVLWLKIILSVVLGFVLSMAFLIYCLDKNYFDTHGIIEQVKRYPADERWIALSVDAFKNCNQIEDGKLLSKAKSKGIGIIVVSAGNKVKCLLYSKKPKHTHSKSFIYKYDRQQMIVQNLDLEA
jgi:hypothetical protein